LNRALAECGDRDAARSSRLVFGLAYCALAGADLHGLARHARQLRQIGEEHGLPLTLAWAHYLLGRVDYEWDDVPAANGHYATVIQLREHAHFKALREATLGLALTEHVMGDPPRAHHVIDELLRFADTVPAPDFGAVIHTFKARLLLLDDDG